MSKWQENYKPSRGPNTSNVSTTVPQCCFKVIQSLVAFREASRSTKLVENPGTSSLAPDKAKPERLFEIRTLLDEGCLTRHYIELAGNRWREKNVKSIACHR